MKNMVFKQKMEIIFSPYFEKIFMFENYLTIFACLVLWRLLYCEFLLKFKL